MKRHREGLCFEDAAAGKDPEGIARIGPVIRRRPVCGGRSVDQALCRRVCAKICVGVRDAAVRAFAA